MSCAWSTTGSCRLNPEESGFGDTLSGFGDTLSGFGDTFSAHFKAKRGFAYPYLYQREGEARPGWAGLGAPPALADE